MCATAPRRAARCRARSSRKDREARFASFKTLRPCHANARRNAGRCSHVPHCRHTAMPERGDQELSGQFRECVCVCGCAVHGPATANGCGGTGPSRKGANRRRTSKSMQQRRSHQQGAGASVYMHVCRRPERGSACRLYGINLKHRLLAGGPAGGAAGHPLVLQMSEQQTTPATCSGLKGAGGAPGTMRAARRMQQALGATMDNSRAVGGALLRRHSGVGGYIFTGWQACAQAAGPYATVRQAPGLTPRRV